MPGEEQARSSAGAAAASPAVASNGNGAALDGEARFREFCETSLSLDEISLEKALRLYGLVAPLRDSSLLGGSVDEAERIWMAGILYVVKKLDRREVPIFTLTQVLRVTNLSVVEFFREITQFLKKCAPTLKSVYGAEFQGDLQAKEDQATFVHLMVLFNYYKRTFPQYFEPAESESDEISIHQRFGWFLFLAARVHVLGRFPDLVTCTNALLGVVAVMIVHMPSSLRSYSLENKSLFPKRDADGVKLISSLCSVGEADEKDVMSVLKNIQDMISSIFPNLPSTSDCSSVSNLQGFSSDGLVYFEGLMEDNMIAANLLTLEKQYESSGEEGYELFAEPSLTLLHREKDAQVSSLQQTLSSTSSPRSSLAMITAAKMPPPTPVSVTMTTAKWLRTVIAPLPSEPSTELLEYLRSCDRDITEEVTHRAKVILEAIFPIYSPGSWKATLHSSGSLEWAVQRRSEASKLYYRVLTALCHAESLRLQSKNLTSVLTSEKFHRCMLACSGELVLATHKTVILSFPAVLGPTGITAFDMSKVIESFVRHEETLPRELKRHLNSIEERLLESMAWEKGSSMYNSLIVARPRFGDEIRRLELMAEPMPSLETLSSRQESKGEDMPDANSPDREPLLSGEQTLTCLPSPVKERPSAFSAFNSGSGKRNLFHLQSVFASPQKPNPHASGETCAEAVMNVFFQKVLKLAASRIKVLCERLSQPSHVVEQIFQVFEYALNRTTIFFNRHIDQIILCSMYGVCKVMKLNVTFRDIIFQYRKQPQSRNHVFRNVYLEQRRGRTDMGDIIKFYNEIYVPATKAFLMNIAARPASMVAGKGTATDEAPSSPPRASMFPAIPDMSPRKVSARHNVFVSPLRNTKVENIMSPHSRSLYACVGESTHAYQSPSKDLTVINCRLNLSNGRRLEFQEPSLMSDSFVTGALSNTNTDAANNDDSPPSNDATLDQDATNGDQNILPSDPQSPAPKRPKLE
ncbi:retinoblastoma-related protein isoform X1 [Selaginella moellendorffii]|uniref:retinoblastoma-related protein isoform X1 n=1 Tax=Selaginella moellendorffii TaxID=88036 RepID=UPI000D1C7E4B|nr:retinoblastoma-related protein isoform X1 [Selaginella moellendorffii]|eukprot:XP_024532966.1 retinoblastoma-related protein isoform X1 [Selaginella moellendorffii]